MTPWSLRSRIKRRLRRLADTVLGDEEEEDFVYAATAEETPEPVVETPEPVVETPEPVVEEPSVTEPADDTGSDDADDTGSDDAGSDDTESDDTGSDDVVVPPGVDPASEDEREQLNLAVVDAVQQVFDPEIPVNIYELGLIYEVDVRPDRRVDIRMTLTSPNCPAAQSLPGEVEQRASSVDGVAGAAVDVVWDPPWDPSMMSDAAKLELNML